MQSAELSVGKQGRIVIPANLRHQLAIEPGTQLIAWVKIGGSLWSRNKNFGKPYTKHAAKFQKNPIWHKR